MPAYVFAAGKAVTRQQAAHDRAGPAQGILALMVLYVFDHHAVAFFSLKS